MKYSRPGEDILRIPKTLNTICNRIPESIETVLYNCDSSDKSIIVITDEDWNDDCEDGRITVIRKSSILEVLLSGMYGKELSPLFEKTLVVLRDNNNFYKTISRHSLSFRLGERESIIKQEIHPAGNLEIIFHNVDNSHEFVTRTLLPFFEKALIRIRGDLSVYRIQEHNKSDIHLSYQSFIPFLILLKTKETIALNLPEIFLDKLEIRGTGVSRYNPYGNLQSLLSSYFIPVLAKEKDETIVFKIIIDCLYAVYSCPNRAIGELLEENRKVFNNALLYSLSTVSSNVLSDTTIDALTNKILREYNALLSKNQAEIIRVMNQPTQIDTGILQLIKDTKSKTTDTYIIYRVIFDSSLQDRYLCGFFPFCFDRLYPLINEI